MKDQNPNGRSTLSPFPASFLSIFVISAHEIQSFNSLRPFSTKWKDFWSKTSKTFQCMTEFESFEASGGLNALKVLSDRGADANLILLLLVKYFWQESIEAYERKESLNQMNGNVLNSIQILRSFYEEFYKRPSTPGEEWKKELPWSGTPSAEVEHFLADIENKVKSYRKSKDFPKEGTRSPPKDKANRTVFAIHCHLTAKTGGPNWASFLQILLSAGIVRANFKKLRPGAIRGAGSPDRLISTHLDSFRRYHPQEVNAFDQIMSIPTIFRTLDSLR